MANKGKTMNIHLQCTIADDQKTATVESMIVGGNYANPDASNPSDKVERGIEPAKPKWDGSKLGDTIVADCLNDFKKQIGTAP